eukprot:scaffold1398_cov259-Pinguiococcus_pyrenoidosus.AAC.10
MGLGCKELRQLHVLANYHVARLRVALSTTRSWRLGYRTALKTSCDESAGIEEFCNGPGPAKDKFQTDGRLGTLIMQRRQLWINKNFERALLS